MEQMNNWFEAKIRFDKTNEQDGEQTKASESYIVNAVSMADAEKKVADYANTNSSIEFVNIKKAKIHDFFGTEGNNDVWYRCKVECISTVDDNGKVAKAQLVWYVVADTFKRAAQTVYEAIDGSIADMEILSITKTNIINVIK